MLQRLFSGRGSDCPSELYDSHIHTRLCRHATGEAEEYAEQAVAMGLRGIVFTCHCPLPWDDSLTVRMLPGELKQYVGLVERVRETFAGRLDVRLGIECDFMPGDEEWLLELQQRASFDYVLGSVHAQLPRYVQRYFDGDVGRLQRRFFEHLARAAESGLFDALAHPDHIKHVLPKQWNRVALWDDVERCLDRIAATGVAMECNTAGVYQPYGEICPGPEILAAMAERGIPAVLGSDAHQPVRVGEGFAAACEVLERAGHREVVVFRERKAARLELAAAKHGLQRGWPFRLPFVSR